MAEEGRICVDIRDRFNRHKSQNLTDLNHLQKTPDNRPISDHLCPNDDIDAVPRRSPHLACFDDTFDSKKWH